LEEAILLALPCKKLLRELYKLDVYNR